ncbi:hypothetical protein ASE74_20240 [Pedobacter sp. Leaf216]|nr:hypothetical protein ASE74_20240 [Pedobacter sp. Leaf216]
MRLIYIILLLIISTNFSSFATQGNRNDAPAKNLKISFITDKKINKLNSDFNQDYESLQKDFINASIVKISFAAFILLSFLMFLFLKNKAITAKVVIRRLKHNYWCHFKMLYPKHVFW